jgi:hypothetical protein
MRGTGLFSMIMVTLSWDTHCVLSCCLSTHSSLTTSSSPMGKGSDGPVTVCFRDSSRAKLELVKLNLKLTVRKKLTEGDE